MPSGPPAPCCAPTSAGSTVSAGPLAGAPALPARCASPICSGCRGGVPSPPIFIFIVLTPSMLRRYVASRAWATCSGVALHRRVGLDLGIAHDHPGQTLVERLVLLDLVLQRADGLLHVERGHVDVLLGSRGVRLVLLRLLHGLADLDRVDALGDAARGLDNPEDALDRARADLHAGDRQVAP